jgi:hypothetical protein
MSGLSTSNLTSGFIDLATYDELEKYMYGGPDATAYFVRQTRKATWFTQVPVVLTRLSGNPSFGTEWSVQISRAGDYLLYTWLRIVLPIINIPDTSGNYALSWTPNIGHNILRIAQITFNDLVAAQFDNFFLDFWSAFTTPAGKIVGYNNMIGNVPVLTSPQTSGSLPEYVVNVPLPFFYARDSGVALPTAALPYNDMRIQFRFRDLQDLLVAWTNAVDVSNVPQGSWTPVTGGVGSLPEYAIILRGNYLLRADVWANYAIVSNDERKRMACAPRDILIEQVQVSPTSNFNISSTNSFDIRFSHAIKVLFFGARNKTTTGLWSNYSTAQPAYYYTDTSANPYLPSNLPAPPVPLTTSLDPIETTSLIYENTARLSQMGSDYYSLVEPYYAAPTIPTEVGLHVYSYSLDFIALDPLGSTNYGKLTNVSIVPTPSLGAKADPTQIYDFIVTAVNNNIIRVSGGKPQCATNSRLPIGCGSTEWVKECNELPVCVF